MQSLKLRLVSLLILSLVFFLAMILSVVSIYDTHAEKSQEIITKTHTAVTNVYEAQVHFKRQVQEWKNILLRGYTPDDYQKYLKKFETESDQVSAYIRKTIETEEKNSPLHELALKFQTSHKVLITQYQRALKIYKDTPENPQIAADKSVRGIDREPSEFLDDLVKEVHVYGDFRISEADANFTEASHFIWSISAAGAILLFMFFYFALNRFVFIPIKQFTQLVEGLSKGQIDLGQRLASDSKSELGVIANHFDIFMLKLNKTFEQISLTSSKLKKASTKFAHITETTNQAIRKQSTDIIELNSSMSTMSSSIDNVVVLSNKATSVANEVKNAATNGHEEVIEVDTMITQLSSNVERTATSLTELNQEIFSISDISDLITSIAEQTSLLSLNAAIEAARAGESGRGFAVVADEVRNLAQKTNDATDQIKKTVERIQKKSEESIDIIQQGTETAKQCKIQGDRVMSALTNITDSIANILSVNEEINCAASTQESLTSNVRNSISEIEADLNVTADGARQNTSDSSDLAQLSFVLKNLISEFKVTDNNENKSTRDVELF